MGDVVVLGKSVKGGWQDNSFLWASVFTLYLAVLFRELL